MGCEDRNRSGIEPAIFRHSRPRPVIDSRFASRSEIVRHRCEGMPPWREPFGQGVPRQSHFARCCFSCFRGFSPKWRLRNQKPLEVQVLRDGSIVVRAIADGSIAFDKRRYETAKDFQAFLRERRPPTVYVRPARDASYNDVARVMTAIQETGGIDVGLVGNEKF